MSEQPLPMWRLAGVVWRHVHLKWFQDLKVKKNNKETQKIKTNWLPNNNSQIYNARYTIINLKTVVLL